MKILIATDSMGIGGAETHVFTLINELRKGNRVTLISAGGVYADALKKSGIRCVIAPFGKRDAISTAKSTRIFKKEMKDADIVHTHTRFTSFLAKRIRGKSSYPKIVTTAHLNFPLFPFGALTFWGDITLAVSEDIRDYLVRGYALKKENIYLTKNAVDFTAYKKAQLNKKLIVHTSRIDTGRAKCAFMLVDSAKDILSQHKDWRIMIVGDGNLFSKLCKKAHAVNDELGFTGVILSGARSDIPSILSHGSIFIGVSRSALEGMACGLPTIICGDEGYGGIVTNDNFDLLSYANFCARGLNVPKKDLLVNDIKSLISNNNEREKLGDIVQKRMLSTYPAYSMANDALMCYKRVFKRPSICLVGYFGYHNLGDEETLKSALIAMKSNGISDVSILCYPSYDYDGIFSYTKKYDRTDPRQISYAIDKSDTVILCGGNLMQNETSLRSLVYYEQIIQLAKRRGKRIYMFSSGFGKIRGVVANFLFKRGMKSCDFCGCRTHSDLETAKKFNDRALIMPDLCFLLPESNKYNKEAKSLVWILSNKEGISLNDISEIANSRNLVPIAINLFANKDLTSAKKAEDYGIKVITPKSYDQLSKILSTAAFSVSERLHGSVFSIISHTPTYILTNSDKNKALLNEINLRTKGNNIIFPYSKEAVFEKKEIGANDSDFNYVIDSLKHDILSALNEIF